MVSTNGIVLNSSFLLAKLSSSFRGIGVDCDCLLVKAVNGSGLNLSILLAVLSFRMRGSGVGGRDLNFSIPSSALASSLSGGGDDCDRFVVSIKGSVLNLSFPPSTLSLSFRVCGVDCDCCVVSTNGIDLNPSSGGRGAVG